MIFSLSSSWSYITMVLFLTLVVILGFYIATYSARRTSIGFSALVTALTGLICSILAVATYRITSESSVVGAFMFFYGMYISFAFVPGMYAFLIISRQMECQVGILLSYIGFIWVAVTMTTGLALSIIISTQNTLNYASALLFFYLSNWVFVLLNLILNGINFKRVTGKASTTIQVYSFLNLISVVSFTIITFYPTPLSLSTSFLISLFFCDLTIAIAMLVAVLNGYLWIDQIIVGSKLDYIETIV